MERVMIKVEEKKDDPQAPSHFRRKKTRKKKKGAQSFLHHRSVGWIYEREHAFQIRIIRFGRGFPFATSRA